MIAVTGSTGFIGQQLSGDLDQAGMPWRALVRSRARAEERLPGSNAELVIGSLSDPGSLRKLCEGADSVVHLAGAVAGLSRKDYFRTNRDGTANLISAAEETGVRRMVLVSSIAAGGPTSCGSCGGSRVGAGGAGTPAGGTPVTWYGESKRAAEELLRESAIPEWSILRPAVVYGPGDTGLLGFFSLARLGLGIRLAGPDLCLSLVHVRDCVRSIRWALDCSVDQLPDLRCVAHPRPWTLGDLSLAMIRASGRRPLATLALPRSLLRAAGRVLDAWCRVRGIPSLANGQKMIELTQRAWVCRPAELGPAEAEAQIDAAAGFAETRRWYLRSGWL